jgi:CHC2 zinc finger
MKNEWVDFKALKEAVTMQMVLDHYGIRNLRKSGDELRGPCPLHNGSARSKNFSVNTSKNAFKCFAADCGARGNVLDFVAAMEHCGVRDAAMKLDEWFKVGESKHDSSKQVRVEDEEAAVKRGVYSDKSGALYEVIIPCAIAEDLEQLVIYRELFNDYAYRIAAPENFGDAESPNGVTFTLQKAL